MAAMCAAENKGGGFDHKVIDARGYNYLDTGCSLNIMFFSKILEYSGLLPFSVFPRRFSRAAKLRKIQKFQGKTQ